MSQRNQASQPTPPVSPPTLYYDGQCPFCRVQAERLRRWTKGRFHARTFQPNQSDEASPDEMKLQMPDGRIFGGAEAAFRAMALRPIFVPLLWLYLVPVIRQLCNGAYRIVARNRYWLATGEPAAGSDAVCLACGGAAAQQVSLVRSTYRRSAKLFLVLLSLLYLVSFVSLYTQVIPLNGQDGLIPAVETLDSFKQVSQAGRERFDSHHWNHPTLFWWMHSDADLRAGCIVGMVLAISAVVGLFRRSCLLLMGVLYLSYLTVGGRFYYFQWDNLQIETTLHALLLPSYSMVLLRRSRRRVERRHGNSPHGIVVFLMRWLLFRLYFESGLAKILHPSGGWCDLTAMDAYYNTAPLPTWLGWYAHNLAGWWLPQWWHSLETVMVLMIELLLPVFLFSNRRVRAILFVVFNVFQLAIILTANYGLFNYTSVILSLFLVDDRHYEPFVRAWRRIRSAVGLRRSPSHSAAHPLIVGSVTGWMVRTIALSVIAILIVSASLLQMASLFLARRTEVDLHQWLSHRPTMKTVDTDESDISPMDRFNLYLGDACYLYRRCRLVNSYHLFANMTRERLVPEIQGQDADGNWRTYPYRFVPRDPKEIHGLLAPYHPRLDFQTWFVGLSPPSQMIRRHPFFGRLIRRIIDVPSCASDYFAKDPFEGSAPRRIRVIAYRYRMSTPEQRKESGNWWQREKAGVVLRARPVQPRAVRDSQHRSPSQR